MIDQNYLNSMDDEIGKDVYFYRNKINEKIDLYTIGCEISEWDGEKVARLLNPDELTENIIIFNTCAVTDFAQDASEKIAKKIDMLYPDKKKYFIGCGVNYNKNFYSKYGTVLTNQEKFDVKNYGCKTKNTAYYFSLNTHRKVGMVKIEDGCRHKCAYCIINQIRPHYIVPYEKIKLQIKTLIKQGKNNIQLLGTEISNYNYNGMGLTDLCRQILKDFPELDGITMGAIDPASKECDSLIKLMKKDNRLYNVLYLCTQSCSDTILKLMNRRHDSNRLRELNELADGKVHFVYQLIIGFPGETDELFQETIDFIKETKPVDYDTIPFSRRKGTPAYDMPNQISRDVVFKRERIIYDLIKEYTTENDFNTNRSFAEFEGSQTYEFVKFKPDLNNSYIFEYDLYNNNSLKELFKILPEYANKDKDIVIKTDLRQSDDILDMFDYDTNIKLLVFSFGVKIITNIKVDNKMLDFLSNTYWAANVIMYRFGTYINFEFDKLDNSNLENLIKLFKVCQRYKIDSIELMTQKLISSGNKELAKEIIKVFEIKI